MVYWGISRHGGEGYRTNHGKNLNLIYIFYRSNQSPVMLPCSCVTPTKYVSNVVVAHLYCAGNKIEKNEMGWACGAYG